MTVYEQTTFQRSLTGRLWSWLERLAENSLTVALLRCLDSLFVMLALDTWFSSWLSADGFGLSVWNCSFVGKALNAAWARVKRGVLGFSKTLTGALEHSVFVRFLKSSSVFVRDAFSNSLVSHPVSRVYGVFRMEKPTAEGVALSVFVFLVPFLPTVLNTALTLALLLGWLLLKIIRQDWTIRFYKSYIPAFLFFVSLFSATLGSSAARSSLSALLLWASYAVVFFIASQTSDNSANLLWVVSLWLVSAALVSLLGLLQYASGVETALSWVDARVAEDIKTRVHSVFDNPNMLAEYLTYAIALGGAFWLCARSFFERSVYLVLAALFGLCLVMTYSRGGWVAAAISLLALALFKDRRLLLVLLAALLIAPLFLPETLLDRAATLVTLDDSSALYRITIWKAVLSMVKHNWLTGVGLGAAAFGKAYQLYEIAGTPAAHSHNLYLQIWAEMGIVALLLFLWTVLSHLRDAVRSHFEKTSRRAQYALVALVGATLGQLFHGLIDNIWYSPKNVLFFWLACGLVLGSSSNPKAEGSV